MRKKQQMQQQYPSDFIESYPVQTLNLNPIVR